MVKKWFSFGSNDAPPNDLKVYEPAEPVPSDVPLPPRRNAALTGGAKPHAADATASPLLTLAATTQSTGK
jgi:hypothetical protein